MPRRRKDIIYCDEDVSEASSLAAVEPHESSDALVHEVAQITKLRSGPGRHLGRPVSNGWKGLVSPVKMLVSRESNYAGRGRFTESDKCHVLSRYLPVHGPKHVDHMRSRVYVSQFSSNGSLFVAGFQRSHIRIYDVENDWKIQKDIIARNLRWTITDTCLSPDQQYLAYSSMSPLVHIVNVHSATTVSQANVTEIHHGLDFSTEGVDGEFSIFSIKFSNDGREIVAAAGDDAIYVYDLMENKPSLRIPAHSSDVNTVCFADESGHLIYSGSDDHLCKVWDRRCFVSRGKAAGVLVGHLEGVTFIDTHGDGQYLISNGKDQAIKLWDIRKMSSGVSFYMPGNTDWDYRWMEYPEHLRNVKHPHDQSLATYRGHSVLCTLIRCYFSPVYSTAQKYIYTGSSEGSVHIYDMVTGNQVAKLEHHDAPVRDCSWHPHYPIMISSSWDGALVKWEFLGEIDTPAVTRLRRRQTTIYY
ncbi:hypothetical protein MLD38_016320 [Melastoma candidum]|uniref:Uncharacterized protein n=1 Tax=Melastoma candidum TaxID=119954 RepID=A0ACB9RIB5_9MYRT|nr:hypothetical protein MLD38_016320 [Melastoma candidum]